MVLIKMLLISTGFDFTWKFFERGSYNTDNELMSIT